MLAFPLLSQRDICPVAPEINELDGFKTIFCAWLKLFYRINCAIKGEEVCWVTHGTLS